MEIGMTYDEIRADSWSRLWRGNWFWKIVAVVVVFNLIANSVTGVANGGFSSAIMFNFQIKLADATVGGEAPDVLKMLAGCLLAPVVLVGAAVIALLSAVAGSFVEFAKRSVLLKAARGDGVGWFDNCFASFRCPGSVIWLNLRWTIEVALLSLLFLVPGIVAVYRYQMAWYLKYDHPDWSAGRCLAESARMMDGMKWSAFMLDCSYWVPFTLALLPMLFGSLAILAASLAGGVASYVAAGFFMFAMLGFSALGCFVAGIHLSLGGAILYREMLAAPCA